MRTIINFFAIATFLSLIIFMPSCKKDKDNDSDTSKDKNFSVTYENEYVNDHAWIVLHSPDGSTVTNYKKITGNGVADFGKITDGVVTVTIIEVDTFNFDKKSQETFVYMETYYNIPCGDWIFSGGTGSSAPIGSAEITMTYPQQNFTEYYCSTSSNFFNESNVPPGEMFQQTQVYSLDEGNKYSVYGMVVNDDGGYCNWLIDQDFQMDQINSYALDLDKPVSMVDFTSSKPLNYFYVNAFWNQRKSDLMLYQKNYYYSTPSSRTNHTLFYREDMPVDEFRITGSYYDINYGYYLRKFYSQSQGITGTIAIPDQSIMALYDDNSKEVIDIEINGTADAIYASWDYYESNQGDYMDVSWYVDANTNTTTLKRPALPQEIEMDLNGAISEQDCYSITLVDYSSATSLSDIANQFLNSSASTSQVADQYFTYSYRLNQSKNEKALNPKHAKKGKRRHLGF